MADKKTFYLTTAIAYTSGKPHIGNTYEAVLADSIVRYKRLEGYDVRFQTGTDEHGQKIELKAEEAGVTPKQFVDDVSGQIKTIWDLMNTSYDKFIRTTDDYHEKQVQKIFKKLYEQGDIYKGFYEGMYCTPCESFFTSSQLVDGKCPDCGRECQPAKEEAYFLKLSKYADRLIEHINTHPEFIQPESRKNEMMNNFLLPGLQDLCVSRTSFKWGIPVDFDPDHVVYKVARKKSAKAGDRPGVTRGKQWITVDQGLELLDTPGILWPKFEDETIGLHLAFTGAVRDAIMDVETLACHLIQLLAQRKPESLAARFKLVPEEGMDGWALLEAGARKRGFLISGGEVDLERMAHILLDEFRGGKMGRITLELPEDLERGADPSGVP